MCYLELKNPISKPTMLPSTHISTCELAKCSHRQALTAICFKHRDTQNTALAGTCTSTLAQEAKNHLLYPTRPATAFSILYLNSC